MNTTGVPYSLIQELIQEQEEYLRNVGTSSLLECVVLSAFSYNFVLTIADEVEFVWTRKWTMGSFIYIVARYLPLPCLIIDSTIYFRALNRYLATFKTQSLISLVFGSGTSSLETMPLETFIMGSIILIASMVLLQLRTYAIYDNKRVLLWALVVLDICALATFVVLSAFFESGFNAFAWLPLLLVESITFILTFLKYWKLGRSAPSGQVRRSSIMRALIYGNFIYFAIIAAIYVLGIGICFSVFTESEYYNTHYVSSVAISGAISAKLFIGLKKAYVKQLEKAYCMSINTPFQALPGDQFEVTLTSEP